MRPLYLPPSPSLTAHSNPWRFWSSISLLALSLSFAISSFAGPQTAHTDDPMEDKYSQDIRADYAKCREEENPLSQYLCTCQVLEKQCETPRRLEHGDWNTVEYWPSNDPAEREVQFILLMSYDILGDFTPINKGMILTCIAGMSDVNVFVGENINPDIKPHVMIDQTSLKASFENVDDAYVLNFHDTAKLYQALRSGQEMTISYTDMDETERNLEFDTFGFDNVSKGWEKLCKNPSS